MSLWPYLITKGWLPYQDIAIAHTPLAIINLALFYKIFGVGILQLKIFTWSLILLTDAVLFFGVKKLWNIKTAFISLLFYIPLMMLYDGNGFWFDLYMGIMAFCSFYFARSKKWLLAGVFWGLAFISKQTAVWFLLPIAFSLFQDSKFKIQDSMKVVFGALLVAAPFTLILFAFNILPSFWNWAVNFGIFVLPKSQGQIQMASLKTFLASSLAFLIFIPLIIKTKKQNINLIFWTIAGCLGVYPRFEYFHFQPAIPFLAIATALTFRELKKTNIFTKIFIPIYILFSVYLFATFFIRNLNEGVRFYERNVSDVASYVSYKTSSNDRIFVLNWWDNIYPLTDTLPSTDPWIPQLPWYTELPGIQEKMVDDLKNNPPRLIIYNPYSQIGLSAYTPQKVYNYVVDNYKLVEKVDGIEILVQK